MYFEETGNKNGPTIIFIHGGGVAGWMWRKQIEYFTGYHCIVPDLPGHGKSFDEGGFSLDSCLDGLAELITGRANGKKAHVIGHSLGAKIAVHLLNKSPEIVDHAVIASAMFRKAAMRGLLYNKFTYKLTKSMMKSNRTLESTAKQFQFPEDWYTQNFIKDIREQTLDTMEEEYRIQLYALDVPEKLKGIDNPVLVLAGDKELKSMRQSVWDLTGTLPNSKGMLLKGALHNYPWAQSDVFNQAIRGWISS